MTAPLTSGDHLTETQFTDRVAGLALPPEAAAHLAACAACRQEADSFLLAMEDAGSAALEWSAAQPVPSLRALTSPAPARRFAFSVPQLSMTAAAGVFLLGASLLWRMDHAPRPAGPALASVTQEDTAAQIATDNQLLQSVTVALNSDETSPYQEYDLAAGPRTLQPSPKGVRSE